MIGNENVGSINLGLTGQVMNQLFYVCSQFYFDHISKSFPGQQFHNDVDSVAEIQQQQQNIMWITLFIMWITSKQ